MDIPWFDPIETAHADIKTLKEALDKYHISDEDKSYETENASSTWFTNTYDEIDKTLSTNRDKKYVIIQLFACHGIHLDGTQYVALNEFEPKFKTML